MIFVDFSGVFHSHIAALAVMKDAPQLNEGLIRHTVLDALRSFNSKFKREYGEMVVCCDSRHYWRKDVFPYYKARRAKRRAEDTKSKIDWTMVFASMDKIKQEIKEFLPYRVVEVEGAEADDVIGFLAVYDLKPNLIVSGDQDFMQLQTYGNVKQYDPVRKRWLAPEDPKAFLAEKIIRGDDGDDVPNVLSPDDCFVTGQRQKPMTAKRLEECLAMFAYDNANSIATPEITKNYLRNEQLLDLRNTPKEIQKAIVREFVAQAGKGRDKIQPYFMQMRLRQLMEFVPEF
jgi:hypothetical protein